MKFLPKIPWFGLALFYSACAAAGNLTHKPLEELMEGPGAPAFSAKSSEYEIKAAFVYQFAKFIEWPSEVLQNEDFCIGVIGKDPFGQALDSLAGEIMHDKPIVIKRFRTADEARGCQMVFIGKSEWARTADILTRLQKAPAITIGDAAGFAERGGMIGFRVQGKKVRFDINAQNAERAGLKISSKLLRLARVVP